MLGDVEETIYLVEDEDDEDEVVKVSIGPWIKMKADVPISADCQETI